MTESDFQNLSRLLDADEFDEAAQFCRREEFCDDPIAMNCLGGMIHWLVISGYDLTMALQCYEIAAKHEYPPAFYNLSQLLAVGGVGVPRNIERAEFYALRFRDSGFNLAESSRGEWLS